ncbi:putative colanic acid biosynthesis acetyltransferase [Sphingopyxis sp.]|uniref:putative colanic acid biosynthesis acetyltransferase n=1 Tax=Sphingopyxis sp. TaxID=1908224 RepID=UPI003D80DBAA
MRLSAAPLLPLAKGKTLRLEIVPSPKLRDRLRRALWSAVWLLLFRPSPIPLHGWRRLLLRLFGARIERGAHPYPSARIWAPWNLVMREGSCLGLGSDTYNVATVTLERGSIVSQRAYLCTASHDIRGPGFALMTAPITIGRNAWVATTAYVGPGVTLADGAVAAAGAVVTKDVGRDVIVGGNPAEPIGTCRLSEFERSWMA